MCGLVTSSPPLTWLILLSVSDVLGPLANVAFDEGGEQTPLLCPEGHSLLTLLCPQCRPVEGGSGAGRVDGSSPRGSEEVPVTPYLFKSVQ